jgi:hypothetical protein
MLTGADEAALLVAEAVLEVWIAYYTSRIGAPKSIAPVANA